MTKIAKIKMTAMMKMKKMMKMILKMKMKLQKKEKKKKQKKNQVNQKNQKNELIIEHKFEFLKILYYYWVKFYVVLKQLCKSTLKQYNLFQISSSLFIVF